MTILYLIRSPGTGHSIDQLFTSISSRIGRKNTQTTIARLPYISRGLWTVWQNLRFVRRLKADIFHVTGDVHYTVLALPASRTILTIHDCFLLEHNRRRPLRYAIFWLFWYYLPMRRAFHVTAVSGKTRQELICHVGRMARNVQVVPNGYDSVFIYRPKPFHPHRPTLLQVGTAAHKNVSRLVDAIDGIACRLVLVGPLTAELRAQLNQRKIDYQHYVDVSRAEVVELYAACDIVTFVSMYEGFGMPVLEAQAMGRVLIASDSSPIRELASGAAHLVDPASIDAIRQGILRVVQDDEYRQRLIDRGLENVKQYTAEIAAEQYRKLYDQASKVHSLTAQDIW